MFNTNPMTGTDGPSSHYQLVAVTANARIGHKSLGGTTRIRVEPQDGATFSFPPNWKAPDGGPTSNRYSIVVKNEDVKAATLDALRVVTGANFSTVSAVEGEMPPVKPVVAIPAYKAA